MFSNNHAIKDGNFIALANINHMTFIKKEGDIFKFYDPNGMYIEAKSPDELAEKIIERFSRLHEHPCFAITAFEKTTDTPVPRTEPKVILNKFLIERKGEQDTKGGLSRALALASNVGDLGMVQAILAQNPDTNIPDESGEMPVHRAAINGHMKILEELVKNGAKLDIKSRKQNTLIHYAARSGHFDVIQFLATKGE